MKKYPSNSQIFARETAFDSVTKTLKTVPLKNKVVIEKTGQTGREKQIWLFKIMKITRVKKTSTHIFFPKTDQLLGSETQGF